MESETESNQDGGGITGRITWRTGMRVVAVMLVVGGLSLSSAGVLASSGSGGYATSYAVKPNPNVYYNFHNMNGSTVRNRAGNAHNGSLTNAKWVDPSTSRFSGAIRLNGSGSGLTVKSTANGLSSGNKYDFSFWMKPTNVSTSNRVMMLTNANGRVGIDITSGKFHVSQYSGSSWHSIGKVSVKNNTWQQMRYVWTGSTAKIYINGTELASRSISGSVAPSSSNYHPIGVGTGPGTAGFYGDVAAVRLSVGRVMNNSLYQMPFDPPRDSDGDGIPNPVDPYPFNAKKTFNVTPSANKSVSGAAIAANNGTFTATLSGVNTTTGSVTTLDTVNKTVGSRQLTQLNAVPGYDKYRLTFHGNATLDSHNLLYSAISSGGVGSAALSKSTSHLSSLAKKLMQQQLILGVLIACVGVGLWIIDIRMEEN